MGNNRGATKNESIRHGARMGLIGVVVTALATVVVALITANKKSDPVVISIPTAKQEIPAQATEPVMAPAATTPAKADAGNGQVRSAAAAAALIQIRTVTYGYGPNKWCQAKDGKTVTQFIGDMCNGLRHCPEFKVNNDLCPGGDPAEGDRKHMSVTYSCGAEGKKAEGDDGDILRLGCS